MDSNTIRVNKSCPYVRAGIEAGSALTKSVVATVRSLTRAYYALSDVVACVRIDFVVAHRHYSRVGAAKRDVRAAKSAQRVAMQSARPTG